MSKLGFYNTEVDNKGILKECDFIFNSFYELKKHAVMNDEVVLASSLSLYNIDSNDLRKFMDDFKLNVYIVNEDPNLKPMNKLKIHLILSQLDFIKDECDNIKRLIGYTEELNKLKKLESIEHELKIKSEELKRLNNSIIEKRISDKEDINIGGRPAIYSEKQLKYAAECKLKGYTYKQIDKELGISKATLYRYMVKNNLLEK